jgi:hypothetical protein
MPHDEATVAPCMAIRDVIVDESMRPLPRVVSRSERFRSTGRLPTARSFQNVAEQILKSKRSRLLVLIAMAIQRRGVLTSIWLRKRPVSCGVRLIMKNTTLPKGHVAHASRDNFVDAAKQD